MANIEMRPFASSILNNRFSKGHTTQKQRKQALLPSQNIFKTPQKFTPQELLLFAEKKPEMIEDLLTKKNVTLLELNEIKNINGISLLFTFSQNAPHCIEQLIDNGTLSIKDLKKTVVTFRNSPSSKLRQTSLLLSTIDAQIKKKGSCLLRKWIEKGQLKISDLKKTHSPVDPPILHVYAGESATDLTEIIQSLNLDLNFLKHKIDEWDPIITTLAIYNPDELIKWIVDLNWVSVKDCSRRICMWRKDTTNSEFEQTHKKTIQQAILDYQTK